MIPSLSPASSQPPKQLVLLLHGWGADGANLIDLADVLAPYLPDAYFMAPNAPEVCEVNPYGYQWFSLMDRNPASMLSGVERASKQLNGFIDTQISKLFPHMAASNVPVYLVGFSQGTMLALHVGLRRADITGIVGFSGALIGAEQALPITHKPPVCLIHGQLDDVVPYGAMEGAQAALNGYGVKVQTHTRPSIGHSIDMEGIRIAGEFLKLNG